jgi:hypothetical protein
MKQMQVAQSSHTLHPELSCDEIHNSLFLVLLVQVEQHSKVREKELRRWRQEVHGDRTLLMLLPYLLHSCKLLFLALNHTHLPMH